MPGMVEALRTVAFCMLASVAVSPIFARAVVAANEPVAAEGRYVILGVDRGRGTVLAIDEETGRKVVFAVQDHRYLQALRRGLDVGIDFDRRQVLLDPVCRETNCTIIAVNQGCTQKHVARVEARRLSESNLKARKWTR